MTKSELRELKNLAVMHQMGMTETVARGLSTLIRSARTKKSVSELLEYAPIFNDKNHPQYII